MASAPAGARAQDHANHSDYAHMESRAIKALSAEEISGLLAGEGLGFALAAELNGRPGPKHTLELASELALSDSQGKAIEEIRRKMLERAVTLGGRIVESERHLDALFSDGHASPESVQARTSEIGRERAELRAIHLIAHLETARRLRPEQIEEYARLRGYPQLRHSFP